MHRLIGPADVVLIDLPHETRDRAIPILLEGFEGIYRWHAKRTLREVTRVRAATIDRQVVGVSMLEPLTPDVGYVYYLAVGREFRRRGLGGVLLDDALRWFRQLSATVVYGAAEEENSGSVALFRSRGFRTVERRELGYAEGGLGAWGLRSRMRLVYGEVLLGVRLDAGSSVPPSSD
jgi:ribosomal protein S18 acetylase RimI-like enzyme